jgi:hypothetical protein
MCVAAAGDRAPPALIAYCGLQEGEEHGQGHRCGVEVMPGVFLRLQGLQQLLQLFGTEWVEITYVGG